MAASLGGSLIAASPPDPLQRPHLWLVSMQGAAPLLNSARERSWSEALPPALQPRYLISRSLLRQRLAAVLQLPADAVPLHSPPGEAPTLSGQNGHVSLSHSQQHLLMAWSPWPIGVDLEWQGRPLQAALLARRFFPQREWRQLQGLGPAQLGAAVLESWVRKEAAIKWQQSGLARELRHWCWDREEQVLLHLERGCQPSSCCRLIEGWLCGVVGEAANRGIWG